MSRGEKEGWSFLKWMTFDPSYNSVFHKVKREICSDLSPNYLIFLLCQGKYL